MSLADKAIIMGRIGVATNQSRIAVMLTKDSNKRLDSFFADTVGGQRYIEKYPENVVGIYHRGMGMERIESELDKAFSTLRSRG